MSANIAYENPFTPSFGEVPAHLAGRRQIIKDIVRALESERRRPELTTIFSGARGTGKTTLLSIVSDEAASMGWLVASITAMPGMLEDIEIQVRNQAAHLLEPKDKMHISSIGIPQLVNIELDKQTTGQSNWRSRMNNILDILENDDTGLLITVDELDVELDEMIQLAAVYQHFVREGRKVALFMAGLPAHVSSLLSDKTVSFLRRAQMFQLGRIDDFEIEDALNKTITENGRKVSSEALSYAVDAIDGFPFMMQLVGFRAWDVNPTCETISINDFTQAVDIARSEMKSRIFEATLRDLSMSDIKFLKAMLEDETDSQISDISKRLGWSSSQVAQYRRRLIEAGLIGERRRGVVGFDLPFFREYLIEDASL